MYMLVLLHVYAVLPSIHMYSIHVLVQNHIFRAPDHPKFLDGLCKLESLNGRSMFYVCTGSVYKLHYSHVSVSEAYCKDRRSKEMVPQ